MIRTAITQFGDLPNVQVVDVPDFEIGPLRTLTTALDTIQNEEALICPVDLLISSDAIGKIKDQHLSHDNSMVTLAVDSVATSGSIVSIDSHGRVLGVQKEVEDAESLVKSAMFMVTSVGFVEYCETALSSGSTTAVSVLNDIIQKGHSVISYTVCEKWFDLDTISDVLAANRYLLESGTVHYPGAIFIPSGDTMEIGDTLNLASGIELGKGVSLNGPCLINRESAIGTNCVIGPYTSMGVRTQVGDKCEIQNAVISGQSKIPNHRKFSDFLMNDSEIFRMEE